MPYFYLQVDRLDAPSGGEFYWPMGCDPHKVPERLAALLDSYRQKGFRITHYPAKPHYKEATRKDGVQLQLTVIEEAKPLQLGINVDWRGDDATTAALH